MSHTSEHELTAELIELEAQLSGLVPCAMSESLMTRVEKSIGDSCPVNAMDNDLDQLEVHLEQMAPASMPMDMLGRMVRAMDSWHENVPVEEKVVQFGESGVNEIDHPSRKLFGGGGMLAAAAAVAMLGAVTALVMPRLMNSSEMAGAVAVVDKTIISDSHITAISEPHDAWIVPDSLSHKVTNTTDRGVVMSRDNTPHRWIRVEYVDRIKVQDEQGREIEIERPGVDIMLLPVETN